MCFVLSYIENDKEKTATAQRRPSSLFDRLRFVQLSEILCHRVFARDAVAGDGRRFSFIVVHLVVGRYIARAHLQAPRVQPVSGLSASASTLDRVPLLSRAGRFTADRRRVQLRSEFQLKLYVRVRTQPETDAQLRIRACNSLLL